MMTGSLGKRRSSPVVSPGGETESNCHDGTAEHRPLMHRESSLVVQALHSAGGPIADITGSPAFIVIIVIVLLVALYLGIHHDPSE